MARRIQLRRGTDTQWVAAGSVILGEGEPGFEINTGKLKIGDGIKTWNLLDYVSGVVGGVSTGNWDGGSAATDYAGAATFDGGNAFITG